MYYLNDLVATITLNLDAEMSKIPSEGIMTRAHYCVLAYLHTLDEKVNLLKLVAASSSSLSLITMEPATIAYGSFICSYAYMLMIMEPETIA